MLPILIAIQPIIKSELRQTHRRNIIWQTQNFLSFKKNKKNGRRTFGITPRIPGGFIRPDKLALIAQVAEKYKGTLKITSGQRIAILGLNEEDVAKAWEDLGMDPGVRSAYSVKKTLKFVPLDSVKE